MFQEQKGFEIYATLDWLKMNAIFLVCPLMKKDLPEHLRYIVSYHWQQIAKYMSRNIKPNDILLGMQY